MDQGSMRMGIVVSETNAHCVWVFSERGRRTYDLFGRAACPG